MKRNPWFPRAALLAWLFASASGCAILKLPFGPRTQAPEVRFITRTDLGLPPEPLELDVVYTIHPQIQLGSPANSGNGEGFGPDSLQPFRILTRGVLAEAFRSAVEMPPGAHIRLERLRQVLAEEDRRVDSLPPFSAKTLILVDFRPPLSGRPDLAPQLALQVFDISYTRYEQVSLYHPRLLVFEDYAELELPCTPDRLLWSLVLAWREILARLRTSDRFQRYLDLGLEPLSESHPDGALLLGIIPPEEMPRIPSSQGHEWVERQFLFPADREGQVVPPHQKSGEEAEGEAGLGGAALEKSPPARKGDVPAELPGEPSPLWPPPIFEPGPPPELPERISEGDPGRASPSADGTPRDETPEEGVENPVKGK